jgi:hypothetical protein
MRLLKRGAGMEPSPVAELAVVLIDCGAVAVVETGTAGVVERETGVVIVARDWRRWTVLCQRRWR